MGDKRTDSGQYYPGGRVIARPGTAPQQVVVQWNDVQGKPQIEQLPERYRERDVKDKINEIASKFATVAVAALIGWSACADVSVQKKRKDEIYNDDLVVVDVTECGSGIDTNTVEKIANRAAEESKKSKLWKADTNGYLTAEGEYFRRDVADCFTASVPGDPETCDLVWEDARNGFYSSPFFSDNPSTYGFLTYSKDHARWELDVGGISTFTRSGTWDDSTIEMSIFTLVRHKVSKETYSKVDRFVWKNELDSKADRSMISATNTTFSNAVMAVTQDFKTNTYTKTETDALIAANKPEYEDVPSNVVWRIEAEGGRFFFKPVRPIHTEY